MNTRAPKAGHRDGSRSSQEAFAPELRHDPDALAAAVVAERRAELANLAPVLDFMPPADDFRAAVVEGLSRRPQKRLACKFLYDDAGSRLFDAICDLPEYYPTRTELQITRQCAGEIARAIGPECLLVEYGSGSSLKTRLLLDHLAAPAGYAPIDISRGHLVRSARQLAAAYPHVPILPVCADYTRPLRLPSGAAARAANVVAYFPGSTIGNFEPDEAVAFLRSVRALCGAGSGLLIGVDLKKDPAALHAAYNDAAGVTAAFNLNLLTRINRELGATFDLARFAHHAFYNVPAGRIEMHLVSLARQAVRVGEAAFEFAEGETVHTENCYKYTVEGFGELASRAGYHGGRVWTDRERRFSLHYLTGE